VNELGLVENRVIELPVDLPASALVQATNFLNTRFHGASLDQALKAIKAEIEQRRIELDELTARVVEDGLALLSGGPDDGSLIVRGQSRLLEDVTAVEDLERIRLLFDQLEQKQGMLKLLQATGDADGVQIFIGAENQLFEHTGCSMILSPYRDTKKRVVGAIGVIGPTRMNYARIIPMVDYTARLIGRVIG
jgi:heat-inducible transcriptional repressor